MNIKSMYQIALLLIGLIFQSYMASAQVKVIQNGNVGIGTDEPEEKLVVDGKAIIEADLNSLDRVPHLNIVEKRSDHYTGGYVNQALSMSFGQTRVATMGIRGGAIDGLPQPNNYFYLAMGGTDLIHNYPDVRINMEGNMGIGGGLTALPLNEKLEVWGGTNIYNYSGSSGLTVSRSRDIVDQPRLPRLNLIVDASKSRIRSRGDMTFWTSTLEGDFGQRMVINTLGNVGIGTNAPSQLLSLQNLSDDVTIGLLSKYNGNSARTIITQNTLGQFIINMDAGNNAPDHFMVQSSGVELFRITGGGNVQVVGNVKATSFISATMSYPDYVFQNYFSSPTSINPNHSLMPLSKLRDYISTHHHLPGIPSLQDVKDNGMNIDVGEHAVKNLEKIEELTLYAIEANDQITALKAENKTLREEQEEKDSQQTAEIDQLTKRIDQLFKYLSESSK